MGWIQIQGQPESHFKAKSERRGTGSLKAAGIVLYRREWNGVPSGRLGGAGGTGAYKKLHPGKDGPVSGGRRSGDLAALHRQP